MCIAMDITHLDNLKEIESHIHYGEAPPPEQLPFVIVERNSPVLISAPHGSRTYRNDNQELWHEEDEYTAGIALLLSEYCGTSVIANIWRSDFCDPNAHAEERCAYKQALRKIVQEKRICWVLDLHGASEHNANLGEALDLGTRQAKQSMSIVRRNKLKEIIENSLGSRSVSIDKIPAMDPNRIASFCQESLSIEAVQVEIKPSIRVAFRRTDASAYAKLGPFSAKPRKLLAMLQALTDFIQYLHQIARETNI